jgi:hypothetical protein
VTREGARKPVGKLGLARPSKEVTTLLREREREGGGKGEKLELLMFVRFPNEKYPSGYHIILMLYIYIFTNF